MSRKPYGSGKGLPPASASYATQADHRRQVEAADVRRLKHATDKARRRLDAAAVAGDESEPDDVVPRRPDRRHTGQGKR